MTTFSKNLEMKSSVKWNTQKKSWEMERWPLILIQVNILLNMVLEAQDSEPKTKTQSMLSDLKNLVRQVTNRETAVLSR